MKLTKTEKLMLLAVATSFIFAFYFYAKMPLRMAIHWNINSHPNGFMPRFWGIFLMPFILALLALLLIAIPRIDPLKKNLKLSIKAYHLIVFVVLILMIGVQIASYYQNLERNINLTFIIGVGVGALFVVIGAALPKLRKNWFAGIRTPWTLSDDTVWKKTYLLGDKLFELAGILTIIVSFIPQYFVLVTLVASLFAAFVPAVYSYFLYEKLYKGTGN